jgi:hypothetical protein
VPLPFTIPLIFVDKVIAGVAVGFATLPNKPLAVTTDIIVTPFAQAKYQVALAPSVCNILLTSPTKHKEV